MSTRTPLGFYPADGCSCQGKDRPRTPTGNLPRAGRPCGRGGATDGQRQRKGRSISRLARHRQRAAVVAHDAGADGQAEPGAFADGLRREERIEYATEMLWDDPAPVVTDRDPHL